jgi:hypothetical protein
MFSLLATERSIPYVMLLHAAAVVREQPKEKLS